MALLKEIPMLKEFTTSKMWWSLTIWGGNHTVQTDPTKHGWCCARPKASSSSDVVIVGRPGTPGCFSAVPLPYDRVDVAIYDDTPEDVAKALLSATPLDVFYKVLPMTPGWGLEAIAQIQRRSASSACHCSCYCGCRRLEASLCESLCWDCDNGDCLSPCKDCGLRTSRHGTCAFCRNGNSHRHHY